MSSFEQFELLHVGPLAIDVPNREATIDGQSLPLTGAEFDLLHLLASHAGESVSRDELCRSLRGLDYNGLDRSIDIRVARLRKKLELGGRQNKFVKTIRGVGYMIVNHHVAD